MKIPEFSVRYYISTFPPQFFSQSCFVFLLPALHFPNPIFQSSHLFSLHHPSFLPFTCHPPPFPLLRRDNLLTSFQLPILKHSLSASMIASGCSVPFPGCEYK
ncbi:hypothetical protein ILYODFUR_015562 [Ilyodon furcidens]|uniref:Uncharacterized protein n=1 Tax=Ilyodon furcidens TaxID=33524 RepID=A0ABV0TUX8_9TELE